MILYFNAKLIYEWGSYELNVSRMLVVFSFNILFLLLMFLIDFEWYKKLFKYVIVSGLLIWVYVYSLQYTHTILPLFFWNFWDAVIVVSFSIIGPGLILYVLHYIKHHTAKYEDATVFGKYHLHEGFFGIIFTLLAIIFYILRIFLMVFEIFWNQLGFFLALINIFLYVFLFLGGFLIFRDWNDVISLKFIEVKQNNELNDNPSLNNNSTTVFKNLTENDFHFFQFPKQILYPIGILITSFSISATVYGGGFLPIEIFRLPHETVIILGFIFGFVAGGFLGKDWLRLFKHFYPALYQEIDDAIKTLKS
ncbi:MAG: hypothetical protein EU535_07755 [Promethearchaeota archaeon]|nr:MAG: hypothetical protein EU535_07755 [Candidatus Lokiarchaeota archaeon]